jgi:hypothetical protein
LFNWLDFGPVPPSVLSSAYSLARMRDKLLSAHADFLPKHRAGGAALFDGRSQLCRAG